MSKAEGYKIRNEEPQEFKSTMESIVTTTYKLAMEVNKLGHNISGDFHGCIIEPNSMGQLSTTLYFKNKGAGDIIAIHGKRDRTESTRSRIQRYSTRNRNRTYELSEKLKGVLKQLSVPNNRGGKVDIEKNITETSDTSGANINNIYVQVSGIDINEILRILYSDRKPISDKKDTRLLYQVRLINPIPGVNIAGRHFLISIDRLNEQNVLDLANEVGLMAPQAGIPIITQV